MTKNPKPDNLAEYRRSGGPRRIKALICASILLSGLYACGRDDVGPVNNDSSPQSLASPSSFTGLIPGVGFTPPQGSVVQWVWPGGSSAGQTILNPSVGDPFTTGGLNIQTFRDRYGAPTLSGRLERTDGTIASFITDAETILGPCSVAVEQLAKKGIISEFRGKSTTHTLVPTLVELHDIGATGRCQSYMAQAGVGSGALGGGAGAVPGIPVIESASSPSPGRVEVSWRARRGHSAYEVQVGAVSLPFPSDSSTEPGSERKTAVVELPVGLGGQLPVVVRAYKGGTAGRWSKSRMVDVEPRSTNPEPLPTPTPEPTITPPVTPSPVTGLKCYMVKIQGEVTSINPVSCDR